MTNSQNPDNRSQPRDNRRRWLPIVRRTGIGLGVTLLVGGAGALTWVWHFVNNDLAPIVQRELTKTLNRPVLLGPVKSFSLTGIRFGPSSLPDTATDPDRATTEAVKVSFDIVKLLTTKTLNLQIAFVNANAYIEQDAKGQWVTIPKFERQEPGFVKIELDELALENANVILIPYEETPGQENARTGEQGGNISPKPPIQLQLVDGFLKFREEYKRILYDVSGQSVAGGNFKLEGSSKLPNISTATTLKIRAQDFQALELDRLLKRMVKLPIALSAGRLDGNLTIEFQPNNLPEIVGTSRVKAVSAKIDPLPKLLTQTNGVLDFQPANKIQIKNVTTLYGKVPAIAEGTFAIKDDSNLAIEVPKVNARDALETLDVPIPFNIQGDVQASLQVRGAATQPVITGTVSSIETNNKESFIVDRVPLANFGAGFTLAEGNLKLEYFRGVPTVGGQITGDGNILLRAENGLPRLEVQFRGTDLPGDALAPLYNIPPRIKIGAIAATGEIVGPSNNLQTTVRWDAPAAAYPASGTAIVKGALETVLLRDTAVKIAGGTASISGALSGKQWQAEIKPENLQIGQLAAIVNAEFLQTSNFKFQNTNLPGQVLAGSIRVQGNSLEIRPDNIDLNGLVVAEIAGGNANISFQLSNNRWQTSIDPSGLQLGPLALFAQSAFPNLTLPLSPTEISNLPVKVNNAYVTLSGTADNFTAEAISANANASLNVAGGDAKIVGRLEEGNWQSTVNWSGVNVGTLAKTAGIRAPLPPSLLGPVSGEISLAGTTENLSPEAVQAGDGQLSIDVARGTVTVEDIRWAQGRWSAIARVSQVQLNPLIAAAAPNLRRSDFISQIGPFTGAFALAGSNSVRPESIYINGSGSVNVAGGTANLTELTANEGQWKASATVEEIAVIPLVESNIPAAVKSLVPSDIGRFSGKFDLAGNTDSLALNQIQLNASGGLSVLGGTADVAGNLRNGQWRATVDAEDVAITSFLPASVGNIQTQNFASEIGRFTGRFDLAGNADSDAVEATRINGSGGLAVLGGNANFTGTLAEGQWQATVAAANIPVTPFLPTGAGAIASELGRVSGSFDVAGTTEDIASIRATGSGSLGVAGGIVTASNVLVGGGEWQGAIAARQVQLSRLSNELRGLFNGNLNVSGSLEALTPQAIRASGNVALSQGIAIVKQPLNATIGWDGEKLQIQNATAPGLNANGFIYVDTRELAAVKLTGVDLNVQARKYNLQDLPLEQLPSAIALRGQTDFTGRISGTPTSPQIVGDVQLYDLKLNEVAFDPVLAGNVALAAGSRVAVQLEGKQDEIKINAELPSSAPISIPTSLSFLLRRGEAIAKGVGSSDGLEVDLEKFPLAMLDFRTPAFLAPGPISGNVSGKLSVAYNGVFECRDIQCALNRIQAGGSVAIAKPSIGQFRADNLEAQFGYILGTATVGKVELLKGKSQYVGTAQLSLGADPKFQANVKIVRGDVQDILSTLQIFRLEDIPLRLQDIQQGLQPPEYASGREVTPAPITVVGADLITQLRRFSEILALLEQQQQARKEASPVPELQELQATFGGQIAVTGSLRTGISSGFQISGENWKWGEYTVEKAIVNGKFENNVLTLLPISFQTGESLIAFSGIVGGKNQTGQLRIENFPVEDLQAFVEKFVDVPLINVTGKLNARATLAGSLREPQARGEVTLVEGTLNRTPVKSALGSFSYSNSRLNFGSTVLVSGAEPIQLIGSIPYKIVPGSVGPDSDRISLSVNVQNEGLALLNLLSGGEVQWVNGKGQVSVRVEGTLNDPVATGLAQIENATIQARLLPEPLTDVTGRVRFNTDRILVEGITGQFSKGQVAVVGVLPLARPLQPGDPDVQNILRVSLDRIALNLKGLYRGGVNGLVQVTNSVLQPLIGGEVRLADGQVLLSEAVAAGGGSVLGTATGATGGRIEPSFDNLKLLLSKNVAIARPPVLNFAAEGGLTINGPLYNLQPEGTIRLRRGQVNLFTTQFRLVGGYEQAATFTPETGLDPYLDVRLAASVSEVTGSRLPSSAISSEIADNPAFGLGSTQTVRIQAKVQGPASKVFDNLELTSSPSRSESEIVALLGGGFVNTLGRGDSTLAIANLAGSALLSPLESVLTNALGLSEFRLFPTIITTDSTRSSTLGLAAEAGYDITRKFSVSILRVLTDNIPTQFNLRYRLDQRTLFRGTTDFSGESRGLVEYEIRF